MLNSRARDYLSYRERRTGRTAFWRILRFVVYLFIGYVVLTHFFITSNSVSSIAMEPELKPGDLILSSPLSYGPTIPFTNTHLPGLGTPSRGDLVVAIPPYYEEPPAYLRIADSVVRFFTLQRATLIHNRNPWENRLVIKRVIGIPGDTVRMNDYVVFVRARGKSTFLPEDQVTSSRYQPNRAGLPKSWSDAEPFSGTMPAITLGKNDYFLIGDNRVASLDSRYFGPVKQSAILAKVLLRYYPFTRFAVAR
jgi:signal peptidase I